MGELAKNWFKGVAENDGIRSSIAAYADKLVECPKITQIVRHHFGEHIYGRELFIPAGAGAVGKIHRHQTLNLILIGECLVRTEESQEGVLYKAPAVFFSGPGIAKAVFAVTDCIFMNVHVLKETTTDMQQIEKELICNSYEEMEAEWGAMGGRPEVTAEQHTEIIEGEI